MATESISDEWMYNEVLDDEMPEVSGGHRRVSIDSTDLLDDVLTFPASGGGTGSKPEAEPEEEVDLHFGAENENGSIGIEDSRSARYNAEQTAKTVQARIESNKTSQSIVSQSLSIYAREPNKKNSVFVGNLTWWTTDMDILNIVKDAGLGEVKSLKFYENRTNGQSKGYVMAELSNEALALGAPDKLQTMSIHSKNLVAAYAGRLTVTQFEAKCSGKLIVPEKPPLVGTKPQSITGMNNPPLYSRPPLASVMGGIPPPILPPSLLPPELPFNPAFPGAALPRPPPIPPAAFDPSALAAAAALNSQKAGGAHLNPAFLQDQMMQGNNVAEIFAKAAAHFQGPSNRPSDEEIADANQRNRAISSSAISRAMSDANSGDYESATDTLKMAITLIKQSITASSESCQILIQSLVDCLHGIERQASGSKRSKGSSHDRYESSRERSSRSNHHSSSSSNRSSSSKHRDRSRERRR